MHVGLGIPGYIAPLCLIVRRSPKPSCNLANLSSNLPHIQTAYTRGKLFQPPFFQPQFNKFKSLIFFNSKATTPQAHASLYQIPFELFSNSLLVLAAEEIWLRLDSTLHHHPSTFIFCSPQGSMRRWTGEVDVKDWWILESVMVFDSSIHGLSLRMTAK